MNKKFKKLLTIEDLTKFCESNNMQSFNSKDSGYQLCIQVPSTFEIDEDASTRGLMRLKIKVAHTGVNRNGSYISKENMEKAMPSLKNRPLLANIHQRDDGEWDFQSHDMIITENEETGEEEVTYIERQVGSFTEDEPYLEYDESRDVYFVIAYAVVAEDYTKATEILNRKKGTKNSCELIIDSLSYNAKERYLDLQDFYFAASCLLGSRDNGDEIGEGMLGSRADIVDFSKQNNSVLNYSETDNTKLIETLEKLNTTLSNFNINEETQQNDRKEEIFLEENKEEILENVETEVEMTEETTEEETIGEETETIDNSDMSEDEESETPEVVENESEESEVEVSEENPDKEAEITETEACGGSGKSKKKKKKCSLNEDGSATLSYELSHDDIRYALYELLMPYEESDNDCYYIVATYDDHFIYQGCNGNYFGQAYKKNEDIVSFDGERYELFAEFITASEKSELEAMRSNYAELAQFKVDTENAQLHAQREAILANEKYAVLTEKENDKYKNEAYAKLISEMDNYSLIDLEKELKSVFADYITNGGNFASKTNETPVSKKVFAVPDKEKPSRYGNLFSK